MNQFDRIPDEQKALPQWVLYKLEEREGQITKVPYRPMDSRRASSTNPKGWATFDVAARVLRDSRQFNGLGFVFSSDDPYLGIDFDEMTPWVEAWIKRLDSYTERSQSGRGVHIIVRAAIPPGGNRKGKAEMYDRARFFVMTGDHVDGTPLTIEDRQAEVDALHAELFEAEMVAADAARARAAKPTPTPPSSDLTLDDAAIIEKARGAADGGKFNRLWRGDVSGYESASEADLALCRKLSFWCQGNARQIDGLFRQSGLYRDKWDERHGEQTYGEMTIAKVGDQTEFYTPSASVPLTIYSGDGQPASDTPDVVEHDFILKCFHNDERGDGQLYARLRGQKRRHDFTVDRWRAFKDGAWQRDDKEQTLREMPRVLMAPYLALSKHIDGEIADLMKERGNEEKVKEKAELRDELRKRARSLNRSARVKNVSTFASRELPALTTDFDKNPRLFNVMNGTYDFDAGFRPHDPEDLISKQAKVWYDATAVAPNFIKFLDTIFAGDYALIRFIQRVVGYNLTGLTDIDLLLFCYGTGANGKSTFFAVLEMLLGDYFLSIPIETLLAKRYNNTDDYHVAQLKGARCCVASEIPEGRTLNESLVKDLTGGDMLTGREPYGKPFQFASTHKLWIFGNHKPQIKGTDNGIWRRVRLIPFTVTIPPEKQVDRSVLLAQFREELPGILNWAIEGYHAYMRDGLDMPEAITTATDAYRDESDVLGTFVREECVEAPHAKALTKNLYAWYKGWADTAGEYPLKYKAFNAALRERGFQIGPGTGNRTTAFGIGLKHEEGGS